MCECGWVWSAWKCWKVQESRFFSSWLSYIEAKFIALKQLYFDIPSNWFLMYGFIYQCFLNWWSWPFNLFLVFKHYFLMIGTKLTSSVFRYSWSDTQLWVFLKSFKFICPFPSIYIYDDFFLKYWKNF